MLRAEALKLSLSRYFTGVPCPKGHVADRWTSSSTCVVCTNNTRNRIRSVEQQQVSVATRLPANSYGTPIVIISRASAKKRGLRRYFTGEPCVHGHVAERMVSNYRCIVCLQAQAKPYIHANYKRRLKNDHVFRMLAALRKRINGVASGRIKAGSSVTDLGCSLDIFKKYIETRFIGNMSWENYGTVWQIDHIIPLSRFDISIREQFLKACHYTNLQPLLVYDNKSKGSKSMEEWLATR